jgi:hypothetical protein
MICPTVAAGDTETSMLPPASGLPAGVTAMTNWTQQPASGGWYGRQVKDRVPLSSRPRSGLRSGPELLAPARGGA